MAFRGGLLVCTMAWPARRTTLALKRAGAGMGAHPVTKMACERAVSKPCLKHAYVFITSAVIQLDMTHAAPLRSPTKKLAASAQFFLRGTHECFKRSCALARERSVHLGTNDGHERSEITIWLNIYFLFFPKCATMLSRSKGSTLLGSRRCLRMGA